MYSHALLAEDSAVSGSIIAYALCIVAGPLFIGEIFKGHTGAFCVWGLISFTDWTMEANADSAMLLFPIVFGLLWPLQHVFSLHSLAEHCAVQRLRGLPCRHASLLSLEALVGVLLLLLCSLWLTAFVSIGYGAMALVLSPCVLWALLRFYYLLAQRVRREWQLRTAGSVQSEIVLQQLHLQQDRLK